MINRSEIPAFCLLSESTQDQSNTFYNPFLYQKINCSLCTLTGTWLIKDIYKGAKQKILEFNRPLSVNSLI